MIMISVYMHCMRMRRVRMKLQVPVPDHFHCTPGTHTRGLRTKNGKKVWS